MLRLIPTLLVTLAAASVLAQTGSGRLAAPGAASALGACHVSPIVENLDRSARFYHDVIGLDLVPTPKPGPLPWDTDPGHLDIHGTASGRLRFVGARMPGVWCGVEIVEFGGIDRKPIHRDLQDPGAVTLILLVRDLDRVFGRLKQAGVTVVTTGGAPITVGSGKTRAVIVKDPDGFFVELAQLDPLPPTTLPSTSDVMGIRLRITVAEVEKSLHVYRDLLGLPVDQRPFTHDKTVAAMMGLPDAEYRLTTASAPRRLNGNEQTSATLLVELIEFKGVERRPTPSRIQDPGSYRLFVNVRDIDATIAALEGAGSTVVSSGGKPVGMTFGRGQWRIAAMPDPNNLFLILLQNP